MGNWGAENFKTGGQTTLDALLEEFPSKLKQAMFAAASHGIIKRRQWDHCALNAASIEIGTPQEVRSFETASSEFGITIAQAQKFVQFWDGLAGTDEECTQHLRDCLEKAGLFSEPGDRPPRIIKKKVFESYETKLREQFDSLVEANLVPGTEVAKELLCV